MLLLHAQPVPIVARGLLVEVSIEASLRQRAADNRGIVCVLPALVDRCTDRRVEPVNALRAPLSRTVMTVCRIGRARKCPFWRLSSLPWLQISSEKTAQSASTSPRAMSSRTHREVW
jgi:hypothetical protein